MHTFNFENYGRVFLIIDIKPLIENTMKSVRFKVDTGADKSTISKYTLNELGYDYDWIKNNAITFKEEDKPTTASGERVNAGYIQLPLINILGYEGKYWPFQIIVDEDKDFRNLLGRDLLTGFNFSFNNDEDTFKIERANVFKPRYKFISNQEINEMLS